MLPAYPHMLLIAGTGRNSGKTTLACRIIEFFSGKLEITALKISPHLHREHHPSEPLIQKQSYSLYLETGINPKKDSARMLAAGAKSSYYLEVQDDHLPDAMKDFFTLLPDTIPLIIESPALIRHLSPGLFIIVDHPLTIKKKTDILQQKDSADLTIENSSIIPQTLLEKIHYDPSGWWIDSTDGTDSSL